MTDSHVASFRQKEDEQLLRFFDEEGIRPGERVLVESVAPYRGTITARLNGRAVVMGTQVAERIWVKGSPGKRR